MMKPISESEIDPAYQQFIQQVVQTGELYSLQDNFDNYAECPSEIYDNEMGEPVAVYCFWHSEATASACRSEEWADYQIIAIDLEEFMTEILIAMDEDENLAGIEFDEQLFGIEVEPIEILSDLLDEISAQQQQHLFASFDELQDYRQARMTETHTVH